MQTVQTQPQAPAEMDTTTPGTLEHLDPNTLVVETNIRTVAPIDKGFIESIAANGVITPILAWRDTNGTVTVRAGQRRTLAAREAGVPTVPVYVVDGHADTAQRVIEQIVENDQREALTDTDRIQAWRQLELEGVSVTTIAKRTGTKRDRVKTGLAVAASETSTAAVTEHGITLDQAAALIDFEDDAELLAELTECATSDPDYFPVAVQRAKDDRSRAVVRERVEAEHAAKGHRILDQSPSWSEATPYRLHHLTTADGGAVTAEDVDGKQGVAVHVNVWGTDDIRVSYYVDDLAALGLTVRAGVTATAAQSGPMTDEQKAERKTLIANNREWDAAETVRREWVTQFLARKTLPKDAALVVATLLTAARREVSEAMSHGNDLAAEMLGIQRGTDYWVDKFEDYLTAHPTKALYVSLAVTLAGVEKSTSRNTWRYPTSEKARYFQTLQSWGYPLCPVERIAAKLDTTDDTTPETD